MAVTLLDPKQIKRVRSQLGLTQAGLAKRAGVSQSIIAKVESGAVDPSYTTLKAISGALLSSARGSMKKASAIASSPIIAVEANQKLQDCIALMRERAISQLPVFSKGKLVGSLSEGHILSLLSNSRNRDLLNHPVSELVQTSFPVVDGDTPIDALYSLFRHVSAVLVSDRGEISGIITKIDVLISETR
jgi:predicted transcriptional regulator